MMGFFGWVRSFDSDSIKNKVKKDVDNRLRFCIMVGLSRAVTLLGIRLRSYAL
jgi:hypothetical protein